MKRPCADCGVKVEVHPDDEQAVIDGCKFFCEKCFEKRCECEACVEARNRVETYDTLLPCAKCGVEVEVTPEQRDDSEAGVQDILCDECVAECGIRRVQ